MSLPASPTTVLLTCNERLKKGRCKRQFVVAADDWFEYITGPCCGWSMPCPQCVPTFFVRRTEVQH